MKQLKHKMIKQVSSQQTKEDYTNTSHLKESSSTEVALDSILWAAAIEPIWISKNVMTLFEGWIENILKCQAIFTFKCKVHDSNVHQK